jgi:hypothetical protein
MADALTHFRIGQILEKLIDVAVIETAVIIVFLKNKQAVEKDALGMPKPRKFANKRRAKRVC